MKKVLIIVIGIVGGLIVLGLIGSALGGGDSGPSSAAGSPSSTSASTGQADSARIGQKVRDGQFEFTVTRVTCGLRSVGTGSFTTATPQGQFCKIDVKIENIGDSSQDFASSSQKLKIGSKIYSADDEATLYASGDNNTWWNSINPGNTVSGAVVFDVPKGAKPSAVELHDSPFSGGVTVVLR